VARFGDSTSDPGSTPGISTLKVRMNAQLRPLLPGFALALLAVLFGFGLGGAFGANEEALKADLHARAMASQHLYADDAAVQKVLDKAWVYYQRAHIHAGVLGASAIALILLLGAMAPPPSIGRYASIAIGIGSIGYGLFWFLAGRMAPVLGSTSAAKESLEVLGFGSPALIIAGTVVVLIAVLVRLFRRAG